MTRKVFCTKLKQETEGLDYPPLPGDIGKKVYLNISKAAWQQWLARQTMFINEYRLNMLDTKAREFLLTEMEKFLFSENDETPPGYVPHPQDN